MDDVLMQIFSPEGRLVELDVADMSHVQYGHWEYGCRLVGTRNTFTDEVMPFYTEEGARMFAAEHPKYQPVRWYVGPPEVMR